MNPPSSQKEYTSLEPSYFQSTGVRTPGFTTGAAVDLFTSTSFLYSLAIMICVVTAGAMYMRAGLYRMESSERGVKKSNEEIKRVTLGLLGVLSLFVILYTFNKGLLTGDVNLNALKTSGFVSDGGGDFGGAGATSDFGVASPNSASCLTPTQTVAALSQSGGFCKNASCTALSGCNYQQYLPIINREAAKHSLNPNLVIAVMCQESKARPNANQRNENGTYDCGLMQLNQSGTCSEQILNPEYNITQGVARLKQAQNAASQIYQNIPQEAGIYASYNCCANGTIPNAPSSDCTAATGFPGSIPKWACPINPGTSQSNMCTVRSTSCGIAACVAQLDSM